MVIRWRLAQKWVCIGGALLCCPVPPACAVNVRNSVVASGGGTVSAGNYRLTFTIAEPVMGTAQKDGLKLTAGFPATITRSNPIQPQIFADSFETPKEDEA